MPPPPSDGRLSFVVDVVPLLVAHCASTYGYHMSESIKTTVYLDAADYRRLQAVAKAEGRSAAELVREAVALYARGRAHVIPSSIAVGRSGRGNLSEDTELLLDGMGRDR